jgi:hypothetical protein
MLQVASTLEVDVPYLVEVDPYLPLSFKTYSEALPGTRYFRIGNFNTSLLEIGIEPSSMLIRKVTLVSFDKTVKHEDLEVNDILRKTEGLPVVSSASLSGDRTDEPTEFTVCLYDNSFCIDWSRGKPLSNMVRFRAASFYLAEHELCRITFAELDQCQLDLLSEHLGRVKV